MKRDLTVETEQLEFKRELPEGKKLAQELIAMSNGKGGEIVIGYDEKTQQVFGNYPDQKVEEKIANIVSDLCEPRINYVISYEMVGKKTVLIVEVYPGSDQPYHIKGSSLEEGTYLRVGSTTRRADRESLARLIREGKNISFDSTTLPKTITLNSRLITEYLEIRHKRRGSPLVTVKQQLLEDLALVKDGSPTIAGALLFCDYPQKIPLLSQAVVRTARFKGVIKGEFLDQKVIEGALPQQIEDALVFCLRNIPQQTQIVGAKRLDQYLYPAHILRGAIVNAVIHREYSLSGASIQIAIFDDRIEFVSPGGLPALVTLENIEKRQYNRNPIIAKRMFELGYFEAWGQGIDTIFEWSRKEKRLTPKLEDSLEQFSLTLYAGRQRDAELQAYGSLSRHEKIVMEYLLEHGSISNKISREICTITKTQAQLLLAGLVKRKILSVQGAGRTTSYVIVK